VVNIFRCAAPLRALDFLLSPSQSPLEFFSQEISLLSSFFAKFRIKVIEKNNFGSAPSDVFGRHVTRTPLVSQLVVTSTSLLSQSLDVNRGLLFSRLPIL